MNRIPLQPPDGRPQPPPRAPLCSHDQGLHRSELVLFLLLVGAVGLAFADHVRVLNRFLGHLPEFASFVAHLFRTVV